MAHQTTRPSVPPPFSPFAPTTRWRAGPIHHPYHSSTSHAARASMSSQRATAAPHFRDTSTGGPPSAVVVTRTSAGSDTTCTLPPRSVSRRGSIRARSDSLPPPGDDSGTFTANRCGFLSGPVMRYRPATSVSG